MSNKYLNLHSASATKKTTNKPSCPTTPPAHDWDPDQARKGVQCPSTSEQTPRNQSKWACFENATAQDSSTTTEDEQQVKETTISAPASLQDLLQQLW